MTTKSEEYLLGMKSVNSFFAMLDDAMRFALPGAQYSKSGAYVWRGYQINKYDELAPNLYYVQIYPGDPLTFTDDSGRISNAGRELVFMESYEDPHHKPVDEFEEPLCVKTGSYYYPFQVSLDLYRSRFFLLNKEEQYKYLKYFIKYAAQSALLWQKSESRKNVTNTSFLNGKSSFYDLVHLQDYDQVDLNFMTVWNKQQYLFDLLVNLLNELVPSILCKEVEWIRFNSSVRNFDFRGYRLKLVDGIDDDAADYLWAIYFDKPAILKCQYMENKKTIYTYDLVDHRFFDLDVDQQKSELSKFIQKSLTK